MSSGDESESPNKRPRNNANAIRAGYGPVTEGDLVEWLNKKTWTKVRFIRLLNMSEATFNKRLKAVCGILREGTGKPRAYFCEPGNVRPLTRTEGGKDIIICAATVRNCAYWQVDGKDKKKTEWLKMKATDKVVAVVPELGFVFLRRILY